MTQYFTGAVLSQNYSLFRPVYPDDIINQILSTIDKNITGKPTIIDVACGTGQLTKLLAPYAQKIIGTDLSDSQIQQAQKLKSIKEDNIQYIKSSCTNLPVPAKSADIITVAQGIHWFDFSAFNAEVDRCLRPGGSLAVLGYYDFHLKNVSSDVQTKTNSLIEDFLFGPDYFGPFWDDRRQFLNDKYINIPMPYTSSRYESSMEVTYTPVELGNYIKTMSCYTTMCKQFPGRSNIVDTFIEKLMMEINISSIDDETPVLVEFPLFLLISTKPAEV